MSKDLEQSILLDFYGEMLTEKQRYLMELYYNEDLSLGEIAEVASITRQGVQDSVKRSSLQLTELEQKLGLVQRYYQNQRVLQQVQEIVGDLTELSKKFGAPKLQELTVRLQSVAAQLEE